jgi:hypothetical protein
MPDEEHLHPNRGWALIRDKGKLTPAETEHLRVCESCHGWLSKFSSLARKAGFSIKFEIPPLTPRQKTGTDGDSD